MAEPPLQVKELVERFEKNIEAYRSQAYNEAQVRLEFINPFFEALGWDVANKQGYAEAYKDVIHEDAIKVGGATKAPDYSFRVGGAKKFFLEAKKPSVNLKEDTSPAYQLRRYAWSAKLPLSILTNFAEFAVYDCRLPPKESDKASVGRVLYLTYKDYPADWEKIASIFSKEAVLQGSFDKFAEAGKGKKGTSQVDEEFLTEIEGWREALAKNLALRNPRLTVRDLNFAVQRTIDRIIFLRMCEDRGVEHYGQLQALLNGENIYKRLHYLYNLADDKYNSGLFHFKPEKGRAEAPDELTLKLKIDDKVLKDIIRRLYYPDSPYEFSVLGADILGNVYEQFLGKVIRLTAGHHAVVEEKPEVKKAGGVYYTPAYIVDYIVKNTVGKLCEGKSPRQIEKLRVLDPACGSGSFLIGAYTYLLNHHRDWYVNDGQQKHTKEIYQGQGGQWLLTTQEKKRILLNNIFGVDIDSQAVEVTKLSLLLRVLEGESEETIGKSLKLFRERALPDLGNNIKCGNSLISPDFYQNKQMSLLDDEERYRINVFDWNSEFLAIMKSGGFDAVIGNPPYIFTREQLSENERAYFSSRYKLSWEKHNTFMLFMELLLRLLRETGKGAFIVPNSWLTIESGHLLRERYIHRLELITDLNYAAFANVSMEPCIFVVSGRHLTNDVKTLRTTSKDEFMAAQPGDMKRSLWTGAGHRIVLSTSSQLLDVLFKLARKSQPVDAMFEVRTGLQAYERGKGTPRQTQRDVQEHVFDRTKRENEHSIRYLEGKDVARYELKWFGMWMQYGPWLAQPRGLGMFTRPRVLLREITAPLPHCLHATFVRDQFLNNKSILNVLHPKDDFDELKVLLCVFNSTLMSVYYKNRAVKGARNIFPKVVIKNLREFPYPALIKGKVRQTLANTTETMLELHRKLIPAKNPNDKTRLEREIEATDRQIDQLVYELYGLTDEEIKIVEAAARQ